MIFPDLSSVLPFVSQSEFDALKPEAEFSNALLHTGQGAGSDFLGWVSLPSEISPELLADISSTARHLQQKADTVIIIGIGGSYLGSKAVFEALRDPFAAPKIVFAGHTLSEDYMSQLMEATKDREIAAVVISKSGTTTEPAVAFRIVKQEIEKRYGPQEAASRIVAITDSSRGALKKVATEAGYKTFTIPDDVGGRFSVLTPVGLLPLAIAGIDIEALVSGARQMEQVTGPQIPFEKNPAAQYAAARYLLYKHGFLVEILASYEPSLQYLGEWWKQLFGESEGKQNKGIFPASVSFTTDLHSLGQYIQEGERILFETVLSVREPSHTLKIEKAQDDGDGLNFLAGRRLSEVNHKAELGTSEAHVSGGVPNIRIEIPRISPTTLGELLYFFEKACGIGGYLLGVNPFDQPGVEVYKKNMFRLLGKPGF